MGSPIEFMVVVQPTTPLRIVFRNCKQQQQQQQQQKQKSPIKSQCLLLYKVRERIETQIYSIQLVVMCTVVHHLSHFSTYSCIHFSLSLSLSPLSLQHNFVLDHRHTKHQLAHVSREDDISSPISPNYRWPYLYLLGCSGVRASKRMRARQQSNLIKDSIMN